MENLSVRFKVDIVKRTDGCDMFIIGVDDFVPQYFDSEEEAKDWISKSEFGEYYITPLYKSGKKTK
jgi:hypothetical protein